MEAQVDLNGIGGCLVVKRMHSEHILQLQQVHVGAKRHLSHAVGVEIKLVVCDLHKMLVRRREGREIKSLTPIHAHSCCHRRQVTLCTMCND